MGNCYVELKIGDKELCNAECSASTEGGHEAKWQEGVEKDGRKIGVVNWRGMDGG